MKICTEEDKPLELVMGNLYQHKDGDIYFAAYQNRLINLQDGSGWAGDKGFGRDRYEFTDVTDKYCLSKI